MLYQRAVQVRWTCGPWRSRAAPAAPGGPMSGAALAVLRAAVPARTAAPSAAIVASSAD
jgi:hypothetical protein